jgi:nicotinate dehydrogenase subunit B
MTGITRRFLLESTGALVVAFSMPGRAQDAKSPLPVSFKAAPELDSWIRVDATGKVTVITGKAELGQGIGTALLQLAAEQLDLDPDQMTLVTADTGRSANEGFTAGSHSMQDSGTAIVNAAFQVRSLLLQQAAAQFGVDAAQLRTDAGVVHAADGRRLGYGALAGALSLHVAATPTDALRDRLTHRWIGKAMPRIDIPAKLTGGASYVHDIRLPGMLHARIVRQPSPWAVLTRVDTDAIEGLPGVVKVVRDGSFLAVVAHKEWHAIKAWRALSAACTWHETAQLPDQSTIFATLQALPARDNEVLRTHNPANAPTQSVSARYTRPYQSHGSVGPSCAVAHDDGGMMTVWTHTQGVFPLRMSLAELLRVQPSQVRCIHVQGSGCYGHNGADDVAADAALVARAMPGVPIRVQWMREQEHTAEPFGCAMVGEARAALDADGKVVDYAYTVWSNTHNRRPGGGALLLANDALPDPLPKPAPQPIPMPEGGGSRNSNPLYVFPNAYVVERFIAQEPLRVSAMRGLGAYLNVFALESFMDELAHAAGIDPVEFRLRHLTDPRARAVITQAATAAGWTMAESQTGGSQVEAGQTGAGRGFAFARYKNLGAYCAIALSLTVQRETGQVRLGKIVAAVDSGTAVNPDGLRNQVEGGIIQSASWTLYEQVTYDRRYITSRDWSGYPILRFPAAPDSIDVHIIDRPGQPFLGTGETAQGPMSAAIANGIFAATGQRLRDLPLRPDRVKAAIGV